MFFVKRESLCDSAVTDYAFDFHDEENLIRAAAYPIHGPLLPALNLLRSDKIKQKYLGNAKNVI